MARPALKRQAVEYIVSHYGLQHAAGLPIDEATRSVQYYRSVKDPRQDLRARMREIAQARVRYGYRRIHVLLKREGWQLGKNQMYRLYSEEQLQLRSKLPRRRKMVVARRERVRPARSNDVWSLGLRFRSARRRHAVSCADDGRRVQSGSAGDRSRSTLRWRACGGGPEPARRAAPGAASICSSTTAANSPGGCWTCGRTIIRFSIDFSRPGKPTDNCYVETFNGSLRDECLNVHWFETIEDAKATIEAWRRDYNESRPHMALNDMSPAEFARGLGARAQPSGSMGVGN